MERTMEPTDDLNNISARKWLKDKIHVVRWQIAASILLGSLGGLLLVVQAYCIASIIYGAYMHGRNSTQLASFFGGLAGVILARALIAWGRERAGFAAGAIVRRQVRRDILEHLALMGPVTTAKLSTGSTVSAAMEQVEALQDFFSHYLPQLFLVIFIPVTIVAFVFPISWAAGGILLTTAPLIPLFMMLVGMGAENISQRHFQALARMSAHFLDTLQGLTTLKIFDCSKKEAENVARVSTEYRRKTMAVLRIAFLSSAVLEFFSSIAIAIVAVYLGLSFLGYIDFGSFGIPLTFKQGFFILLLAPEFYLPFKELGGHYHARASAIGATEEILKILNHDVMRSDAERHGAKQVDIKGNTPASNKILPALQVGVMIEFENVSVDFGRGHSVLKKINFRIAPGQRVAVIGPSGAGKSTLIHLLLRFIDPNFGQIKINHTRLTELSLESWRRQLAWMGQQPILFPGSIAENIRLARPDADNKAVYRAASVAGVLGFCAQLPCGINTIVKEKGLGLSQGQAQRVALARAYLKQAPLLLLDEPTAGLDEPTEKKLIKQAMTIFKDKTVLMVTHSKVALRGMDRIIRIEQGQIVDHF
jgi:ATP-binding cassette subfamily C protein CydD